MKKVLHGFISYEQILLLYFLLLNVLKYIVLYISVLRSYRIETPALVRSQKLRNVEHSMPKWVTVWNNKK